MISPLASRLLTELLASSGGATSRFSVIGLSKNAGKTVTLNHIIRAAAADVFTLGLVSTGRDGEEQDAVTELPKPRIWAPAGAWVATAAKALTTGTAEVEVVRELDYSTPFGRVLIGRVTKPGEVLLIGPGTASRIGDLLGALEECGANLSLVDGSFDRIAAAAPAVTGRVVLAAGAAYSTSMAETVGQVRHLLDLFDLPAAPHWLTIITRNHPVIVMDGLNQLSMVPVISALADPEVIADAAQKAGPRSTLVINGALGDRLLLTLIKRRLYGLTLLVNDPTHILVGRNLWRRWRNKGGKAYVRDPVRLLAVTTNPHSPVGQDYDPHEFLEAIAAIAGRPVFNLEAGLVQYPS